MSSLPPEELAILTGRHQELALGISVVAKPFSADADLGHFKLYTQNFALYLPCVDDQGGLCHWHTRQSGCATSHSVGQVVSFPSKCIFSGLKS